MILGVVAQLPLDESGGSVLDELPRGGFYQEVLPCNCIICACHCNGQNANLKSIDARGVVHIPEVVSDLAIQSFLLFSDNPTGYTIREVSLDETKQFILKIHYARRMPPVSHAYGLIHNGELVGIVTYGIPANQHLCNGVCGEEHKSIVLELNRLCLLYNKKNEASMLVGRSLKMLPKPRIIVSYADTAHNHTGIVYQACNFLFTGTTKERTDPEIVDGKHPRHHEGDLTKRQKRSAKHRYVCFVGDKKQVKALRGSLKYPIEPYPKPNTQ